MRVLCAQNSGLLGIGLWHRQDCRLRLRPIQRVKCRNGTVMVFLHTPFLAPGKSDYQNILSQLRAILIASLLHWWGVASGFLAPWNAMELTERSARDQPAPQSCCHFWSLKINISSSSNVMSLRPVFRDSLYIYIFNIYILYIYRYIKELITLMALRGVWWNQLFYFLESGQLGEVYPFYSVVNWIEPTSIYIPKVYEADARIRTHTFVYNI